MILRDPSGHGPLDRRTFLGLGLGGLVVAGLPRALAGRQRVVTRTVPVMGTIAQVKVVHGDVAAAESAIDAAIEELRRVDRTMTRFSRYSEVGVANQEAAKRAVVVSAATACVVERALHWAERTQGAFDPCLGEVTAFWDVEHRHAPPSPGEMKRFAGAGLYRHLEVGRRAGETVLFYHSDEVALDLGGIAKGYAVDRAVDALRARGIRDAVVVAGGDLYAMGHSERGDPWEVGVQSPTDPEGIIARFQLTDRAVATSGDYRRFFEYRGRRYSHLIDPRTGEPRVTGEHSVTVEAPTCMDADAGGTSSFGLDPAMANAHVAAVVPGARVIHHA